MFGGPRLQSAAAVWLTVAASYFAACARSGEVEAPSFRVLSVTTTAATPLPGRLIDLFVSVANETDDELRVVELELYSDAPAESIWLERVTPLPVNLVAGGRATLQGTARLPFAFTDLTIDAAATALSADGRRAWRGRRAEVPLLLHAPQSQPPTGTDLIVTVLDEEEDGGPTAESVAAAGGAADLSLREALNIANNRSGADLVRFDPVVFPPSAPARLLFDRDDGPLRVTADELAVDGSGAGVIISPIHYDNADGGPVVSVSANGFSLASVTFELEVSLVAVSIGACTGCVVRDCRFVRVPGDIYSTAGIDVASSTSILLEDLDLVDVSYGIGVTSCDDVTIRRVHHAFSDVSLIIDGSTRVRVEDLISTDADVNVDIHGSDEVRLLRPVLSSSYAFCAYFEQSTTRSGIEDGELVDCGNPYTGEAAGGVLVDGLSSQISVRRTPIDGVSLITLGPGANGDLAPPVVAGVGPPVTGSSSAPSGSLIDLYTGPVDEDGLREYASVCLGEATVDAGGAWTVNPTWPLESGWVLRATVTDPGGNTSEMSAAVEIP